MTEQEWLTCTDPEPMLKHLHGKVSDRKMRLFMCACCERIWPVRPDQHSRTLLDMAVSRADGLTTDEALRDALQSGSGGLNGQPVNLGVCVALCYLPSAQEYDTVGAATSSSFVLANSRSDHIRGEIYVTVRNSSDVQEHTKEALVRGEYEGRCAFLHDVLRTVWLNERESQASLLRDIIGNAHTQERLDPACRTSTVVTLAESIYAGSEFHRLPVLAAVLVEAGCNNQEIIRHCLSTASHVRGCWVVDLLLGKE